MIQYRILYLQYMNVANKNFYCMDAAIRVFFVSVFTCISYVRVYTVLYILHDLFLLDKDKIYLQQYLASLLTLFVPATWDILCIITHRYTKEYKQF